MRYLWLTLNDLKNYKILIHLFIPFFLAIFVVSIIIYTLFGVLVFSDIITQNTLVQHIVSWVQHSKVNIESIPFIGTLIVWIISIFMSIVIGMLGLIISGYMILLFAMIITGFMTNSIVKTIHELHYSNVPYKGHGSSLSVIWDIIWFGFKIILLMIVTLPVLLIPMLNVIWLWIIGFLSFRYFIISDVGHIILSEGAFKKTKQLTNWQQTSPNIILYTLSAIPFLSLFIPVLAVIATSHYQFKMLQNIDINNANKY